MMYFDNPRNHAEEIANAIALDDMERRRAAGERIADHYRRINTRPPRELGDLSGAQRLGLIALLVLMFLGAMVVARAVTIAPLKARADILHFEQIAKED